MPELVSLNPATGDEVGRVSVASTAELDLMLADARQAQIGWGTVSLGDRAKVLRAAGRELVRRAKELGELLSMEMGKPLAQGRGEVGFNGAWLRSKVPGMAEALAPRLVEDEDTSSEVQCVPFGVAGVISPWNYPLSMPQWLLAPALMAGNSVLLKPSEQTPLITAAYVDVLNQFLPEGVLQLVQGGDEQGKAVVAAADLVGFTGSRAAGQAIMRAAAERLTPLVLELGGKDPLIVLPGANIQAAAEFAADSGFENAGQMCVSTERVYCHAEVLDEFLAALVPLVERIRIGCWDDPEADIGPMIDERQRAHVLGQIDAALAAGARQLCGGDHPPRFVRPTVLADATDDMDIMREETFGPVLSIASFTDAEDAVRRANDNPYGLGAAVFGPDEEAAAVAERLQSGMVGINKSCFGAAGTPWVGAKQSGYGFHGGAEGTRQFAQRRVLSRSR